MRAPLMLSTLSLAATLAVAGLGFAPRVAHADVAERCGYYGCSYIRCNYTGDYCRRFDDYGGERYGDYGYGRYRYSERYGRGHDRYRDYPRYRYDSSNWERHRRYQRWYGNGAYESYDRGARPGCYDRRYCETYDRSSRDWYDD